MKDTEEEKLTIESVEKYEDTKPSKKVKILKALEIGLVLALIMPTVENVTDYLVGNVATLNLGPEVLISGLLVGGGIALTKHAIKKEEKKNEEERTHTK